MRSHCFINTDKDTIFAAANEIAFAPGIVSLPRMMQPKAQIQALQEVVGRDHVDITFKSLPKKFGVMTACSGSGVFELAAVALKEQLNTQVLAKTEAPFKADHVTRVSVPQIHERPRCRKCSLQSSACSLHDFVKCSVLALYSQFKPKPVLAAALGWQ